MTLFSMLRRGLLPVALVALGATTAIAQAEGDANSGTAVPQTDTWNCLTSDTYLAFRAMNFDQILAEMRAGTQYGREFLSPERIDQMFSKLGELGGEDFKAALSEVGLSIADFKPIFDGADIGFAIQSLPIEGLPNRSFMVGWLHSTEEHISKLRTAVEHGLSKAMESEDSKMQRIDSEVGNFSIMHVSEPQFGNPRVDLDALIEAGDVSSYGDQLRKAREMEIQVDHNHAFVATSGSRLVVGFIAPADGGQPTVTEAEAGLDSIDWSARSGVETATARFERLLNAHETGGAADGFSAKGAAASTRGNARTAGTQYMELQVDFPRFNAFLAEDTGDVDAGMLSMLGVDQLKWATVHGSWDGRQNRVHAFADLAEPRSGIWSLIGSKTLDRTLPAWIPRSAVGLNRYAFNFSEFYASLKQMMITANPEFETTFAQVEIGAASQLGVALPDFLGAFGDTITMVEFPSDIPEDVEKVADIAPFGESAIVWPCDTEIVARVIKQLTTQIPPGVLQTFEDEVGFSGFRIPQTSPEVPPMTVAVGSGKMAIAIGAGTDVKVFSALTTDLAPEDQFSALPIPATIEGAMPMRSPFVHGITDFGRYAAGQLSLVKTALGEVLGSEAGLFELMLPEPGRSGDMYGPHGMQGYWTAEGLHFEIVQLFQPAKSDDE